MKKGNWLLWLGGGLALWLIGRKAYSSIQNAIEFGMPTLSKYNIDVSKQKILISLPVINKTPAEIDISDFKGNIYYGRDLLGQVDLVESLSLAPNAESRVTLVGTTQNLNLLSSLINIISSGQFLRPMNLQGELSIPQIPRPIPISESVTFV